MSMYSKTFPFFIPVAVSSTHIVLYCSFHGRDSTECGFSTISGRCDYVSLMDRNDEMTNHLSVCHLKKNSLKEHEVILAHAGIFRWAEIKVKQMVICPKHRDHYGKYWRSAATCQYPGHKGKSHPIKQGHNIRMINLETATQAMDIRSYSFYWIS